MEKEKIGFFSRIKIAVVNLENYSLFLEEKLSVAVKYFFQIVLILTLVIAGIQTFDMLKMLEKGYHYIQEQLPDFSYENGNLHFPERIFAYDEEYDIYMIADTGEEVSQELLQEYNHQIKSTGLIFLKNQVIYQNAGRQIQYSYQDLSTQYGKNSMNKTEFLQEIDKIGKTGIGVTIFLAVTISVYIVQMVMILMDWVIISVFALIASRVCKIRMPLKHCFRLSIYALTLPIILHMVYQIAYYFAGFYTQYFRLVYLLISYVYIVAVILMMKSDLLKQQVEIAKMVQIQKEIQEESQDTEEKEEEKNKENKKPEEKEPEKPAQNPTDPEPDGSEI